MNAVHRLYQHRKSLSTTVYRSRGYKVKRCEQCRISVDFCICELSPNKLTQTQSNTGFLLLMYDTEILKPSNTGKLIADLITDTYAFLWSRTVPNPELLTLLNDDKWQPFVVFPAQYAEPEREIFQEKVTCEQGKRPLFVMLDGNWSEAKKMFRKSPYLANFPIVSFDPNRTLLPEGEGLEGVNLEGESLEGLKSEELSSKGIDPKDISSRYQIRKAAHNHQFATAEVAARVLDMAGETDNAILLDLWFDVFNYQYQKSVCQKNQGNLHALENYQQFIEQNR